MCESFTDCEDCPLYDNCDTLHSSNEELRHRTDVVEKWSKEHPIKFIKMNRRKHELHILYSLRKT